jgi:hypothetical protein
MRAPGCSNFEAVSDATTQAALRADPALMRAQIDAHWRNSPRPVPLPLVGKAIAYGCHPGQASPATPGLRRAGTQ